MKKNIILIAFIFCGVFVANAQKDSLSRKKLECYVATSLSVSTNDNFKLGSYTSVETGVFIKNIALGLSSGRGNLDFSSEDKIQNYWYEAKSYVYFPVGSAKGYLIGGYGGYYKTSHMFIEYGIGAAYSVKRFDFSITVSNWSNTVYITPGVCYNFKL